MTLTDHIERLRDTVSARIVYGDPVERDGVTVIPAAFVVGGGGGGGGTGAEGQGEGIGVGIWARPVGAYVIREGDVRWVPAVDLYLVLMVGWLGFRIASRILRRRARH